MTMKDETKNWVAISKYTGNVNAEMARDFLNDNDIPAFINSDFFGSAYHLNAFNMPGGQVRLYIPEEYLQKALDLLQSIGLYNE